MTSGLLVPPTAQRPGLTRSRSSSSPTATREDEKNAAATRPSRPTHTRSRSYLSPTEIKPTAAVTFPTSNAAEKSAEPSRFHRLHLPGRHHHNNHDGGNEETKPGTYGSRRKHRYTQSEAQYHKKRESLFMKNDSPQLSLSATSTNSDQPNDLLYPTSRGTAIPSLIRMASTRSYRGTAAGEASQTAGLGIDARPGLRRRATSAPRSPTHTTSQLQAQTSQKSPIELQLERSDLLQRATLETATHADVKRKEYQLQTATTELQDRLTTTTRTASELMRRLDDAQDTLVRTTESLVDTNSSFTNLFDQSSQLVTNFEHESRHLDREIRGRVAHFRTAICVKRNARLEQLEKRGNAMSQKATELGQRLENCRTIVKNWEERELNKRRAWRGVWVGIAWGVAFIAFAVVAGVTSWKATEISRGGGGTAAGKLRHMILLNESHDARMRDGRRLEKPGGGVKTGSGAKVSEKVTGSEDRGLRLLDEL